MEAQKPRLALVIGSGGVRTASAIGVKRVLERAGLDLDLLVGCSGGSLFAAAMAFGWDAAAAEATTRRLWTRELTSKRRWRSLLSIFLPRLLGLNAEFGLLDDRPMLQSFREAFGEARLEQAQVPLRIATTDFMTGEPVILADGPVVDALRASVALPYIFSPWRTAGGRLLTDGYLSNPLPVEVALTEGAEVVLALGFEANYPRQINSLPSFSFQVNGILANSLLRAQRTQADPARVISIQPDFGRRVGVFDVEKIGLVIDAGERAMEAELPRLREAMGRA